MLWVRQEDLLKGTKSLTAPLDSKGGAQYTVYWVTRRRHPNHFNLHSHTLHSHATVLVPEGVVALS